MDLANTVTDALGLAWLLPLGSFYVLVSSAHAWAKRACWRLSGPRGASLGSCGLSALAMAGWWWHNPNSPRWRTTKRARRARDEPWAGTTLGSSIIRTLPLAGSFNHWASQSRAVARRRPALKR